jgi:quinol-cytochrome oxidoreductase complex cytochrome b subunit
MTIKNMKTVRILLAGTGCVFGLLAFALLIAGLDRVNWQVTELIRQYLVASGMIRPIHTLVDFYTHIKGIEYIICVIFFIAFPIFYQYVDKRKANITTSTRP